MTWNQLLLILPILKNQILIWESFKDIQPWVLVTLIAVT